MIFYIVCLVFFLGLSLFIRPSPESFRDKRITIKENFLLIKTTLFLGVLLLTIHLFATNFTFLEINELIYKTFSINNISENKLLILQFFTHNFIHFDLNHLLGNLVLLGLLSMYERRVGVQRYLIVFFVSGLISGLSVFFYEENILSLGVSGSIFGLAAAYFTDEKNLNQKDWLYAIFTFFVLSIIFSFHNSYEINDISYNINHIAHFLGAISAIIFTRLFKLK